MVDTRHVLIFTRKFAIVAVDLKIVSFKISQNGFETEIRIGNNKTEIGNMKYETTE